MDKKVKIVEKKILLRTTNLTHSKVGRYVVVQNDIKSIYTLTKKFLCLLFVMTLKLSIIRVRIHKDQPMVLWVE